jgi:hypothetical protein
VLDEDARRGDLVVGLRLAACWTKGGNCRSLCLRWCGEIGEGIERRVASSPSPQQTKIEQLESSAPSSTTDDGLIKKNEKLKAKLASSQEAIENLQGKMEILSIHIDELTKLENIGSTPEVSLVEMPKIIKKRCFYFLLRFNLMILTPAIKFLLRMLL